MTTRFDAEWLSLRRPFDDEALDTPIIDALCAWAAIRSAVERRLRVVDLGSGTGIAIERLARWLPNASIEAFAVDHDQVALSQLRLPSATDVTVHPLAANLLEPLGPVSGPEDGTIDIVLAHAVADLVPLDAFASRVAGLLRPGGIAHIALTYDGLTSFSPGGEPELESRVVAAYHTHMDRPRTANPAYGGATAGRRLAAALRVAGLEVTARESWWDVRASRGPGARAVLDRMLRFVGSSLGELGDAEARDAAHWLAYRRRQLADEVLRLSVRHVDVLARRPTLTREPDETAPTIDYGGRGPMRVHSDASICS